MTATVPAAPAARPAAAARAAAAVRDWPWWVQVLAVYGAARLVSAVILLVVAHQQAENLWTPASPSYAQWTGRMWDASWYRSIAEGGYPSTLPRGDDGAVEQNAWAFYPLFPVLARGLTSLTGLGWDVVAPTLSLLLGAAAMLVIHRLVAGADRAVARRPGLPLATVAVVSVFPSSPVLQTAYTESLGLLLVATTLLLLVRRRYEWAAGAVLLLGLSRAVALPMACVVLWHGLVRARHWWRARAAAPAGARAAARGRALVDGARVGALLVITLLAGVAWQLVVGAVTGERDAYFRTQSAWRAGADVVPVQPWIDVSRWLWGDAGPWIMLAVLVAFAAAVLSPPTARLGPELQAWSGAYLAYLVAVVPPGSSLVRFLLLAFPLGASLVGWTRSRLWFWCVVVASVAGQLWWVWTFWRLVPPSGWPP
ncbi:hypothetical protein [Cellulomonas sp. PhB143]|uniref:hypothetical protein n=1 Tax=Cellulomonas sp. PhB143 TaxID=2485186 RepID=UPI000F4A919E|nr:hypothetical protein [Cellulomonas sp. PhB143]ROS76938.1 hypothetical protein EDF32_0924 [Cellulomonas sp. PhB143]